MFDLIKKAFIKYFSNTLYFPGCLTHFKLKKIESNYKEILKKHNLYFITIEELNCCGSPLYSNGYFEDFKQVKENIVKVLNNYGIGKIILNCPACYNTFKNNFPDFFCHHITQIIEIKKLKTVFNHIPVFYHDPCHLGRYSNIYLDPRKILKKLGFRLIEYDFSFENSFCCGGGGGLRSNFSEVSLEIAKKRVQQISDIGVEMIITTCPMCYLQLKEASKNKLKIKEISEVIICGLE